MFTRTAFFHTRVVVSVVLIDGTSSAPNQPEGSPCMS